MTTIIHIYAPKGSYIGQTRRHGRRRWMQVTGKCKTPKAAMAKAVTAMGKHDKRARVLFCTDWHEPQIVMECNKR